MAQRLVIEKQLDDRLRREGGEVRALVGFGEVGEGLEGQRRLWPVVDGQQRADDGRGGPGQAACA
jgi:hypothetical protein